MPRPANAELGFQGIGHASSSGNVCAGEVSDAAAPLVSGRSGVDATETAAKFAADLLSRFAGQLGLPGDSKSEASARADRVFTITPPLLLDAAGAPRPARLVASSVPTASLAGLNA